MKILAGFLCLGMGLLKLGWTASSEESPPETIKLGTRTYTLGIYFNYQKNPTMGADEKQDRNFGYPFKVSNLDPQLRFSLDPTHPKGAYNYNQYYAPISPALGKKLSIPYQEGQTLWLWCAGAAAGVETRLKNVYYVGRIHGEEAAEGRDGAADWSELDVTQLEFKLTTYGSCQENYFLVSDQPFPRQTWRYMPATEAEKNALRAFLKKTEQTEIDVTDVRKIENGSGRFFFAYKPTESGYDTETLIVKSVKGKHSLVDRKSGPDLLIFGDLDEDGLPEIGIPNTESIGAGFASIRNQRPEKQ